MKQHAFIPCIDDLYSGHNQVEFDLKIINQEFLLLPELLNKHSIQGFAIELSL